MNYKYYLENKKFLGSGEPENPFVTFLLSLLIIFMCIILYILLFFQLCHVVGDSMQDTYFNDDFVIARKVSSNYKINDVIILRNPQDADKQLIKRIVALGGEKFMFKKTNGNFVDLVKFDSDGNEIIINEKFLSSDKKMLADSVPFDSSRTTVKFILDRTYTVPAGEVLFLGDNRNNSRDSRYYGTVKMSYLIGRVEYRPKKNSLIEKFLRLIFHDYTKTEDTNLKLTHNLSTL